MNRYVYNLRRGAAELAYYDHPYEKPRIIIAAAIVYRREDSLVPKKLPTLTVSLRLRQPVVFGRCPKVVLCLVLIVSLLPQRQCSRVHVELIAKFA